MTRIVLVTGATGFIASHVIKLLLLTTEYKVRGTVRDLQNESKYSHLTSLLHAKTRLELVEANLLDANIWLSVVDGCDVVMHIASPYVLTVKDPLKDLILPAVHGTENVISAAIKAGIQHIILTSSIAAITDAPQQDKIYTEADWNSTSNLNWLPYYYSKTQAEKKAWDLVLINPSIRLAVLNPAMVIGPSMTSGMNESVSYVVDPLLGKVPVLVQISWPLVDVRDVAMAHVQALTNENIRGRYILVKEVWTMKDVVDFYRVQYPQASFLPRREAPDWIVRLYSSVQPTGTKQYLQANLGRGKYAFSNARSIQELKINYRTIEESLHDTIKNGLSWGLIPRSRL